MIAKPECDHCFLRQAADAARRALLSSANSENLLKAVKQELARLPTDVTPPVRASRIHALIREISGNPDPYHAAKQEATEHALNLYPRLKQLLAEASDPLESAIRLAIAGNIIDLGVASEYDLEASIERVLAQPLGIDHLSRLKAALKNAKSILYLADNAGEIVLDRLLIEQLLQDLQRERITVVVKGSPVINDATMVDAQAAGIRDLVPVIDNGADAPGTILEECSEDFRRRFEAADLVIAKGQGNYETLSEVEKDIFFVLKAKCPVIARDIGCEVGSLVLRRSDRAVSVAGEGDHYAGI